MSPSSADIRGRLHEVLRVCLLSYLQKKKDELPFARCGCNSGWRMSHCFSSLRAATTRLLLENVNCVIILHVEACRGISFIDRLAVKSEPNILDAQARPITVSGHELPQWRVLFDFKMHNAAILSNNLQIYMLVVGFDVLEIGRRESGAERFGANFCKRVHSLRHHSVQLKEFYGLFSIRQHIGT